VAQREIDLLREYRTRLIADAVTGNVDVRAVVAGLPDQVGEIEPFDEGDADAVELDEGAESAAEEADA
jgi:type I restriction enzyme, S subunit